MIVALFAFILGVNRLRKTYPLVITIRQRCEAIMNSEVVLPYLNTLIGHNLGNGVLTFLSISKEQGASTEARALKTIADAMLGHEIAWVAWIFFDLTTQMREVDLHVVRTAFIVVTPNLT